MKSKLLLFSALYLLAACGPSMAEKKKQESIKNIKALEEKVRLNFNNFNAVLADSLTSVYTNYAHQFPQDSLSPEYLFKAAKMAMSTRKFKKAIALYDTISQQYPNFEKNPHCKFMIGFIYDEHLKLKDKAADAYTHMIETYPDHRLAKDAQLQKEHLKYTNEELIKMFQNKPNPWYEIPSFTHIIHRQPGLYL